MPIVESQPGTPTFPYTMSEWVHPTGTYIPYSGTYPDVGYGYPAPTSDPTSSLGQSSSGPTMARGANYFFGFLITFITLLLLFIACGIGSRRRVAGRRRRHTAELMENSSGPLGTIGFGGLLGRHQNGGRGNRRLMNEEILRDKPTYHDIWLSLDDEKRCLDGNGESKGEDSRKSNTSRSIIKPLSATLVRLPKDFQPYQHFHDTLDSTSSAPREILSASEVAEGGPWYSRLLQPAWTPRSVDQESGTISPTSSAPYHTNTGASGEKNDCWDSCTNTEANREYKGADIAVAVVVLMPRESLVKSSIPRLIPECQMGVTRGRVIGSGVISQDRTE